MIIFVLPGFTSHNPSRKFEVLRKYLPNCTVIGLSYQTYDPNEIRKHIETSIQNAMMYHKDYNIVFLGTSLGAFIAKYVGMSYHADTIMINPALDPIKTLEPYIGYNENVYTNEIFHLSTKNVKDFKNLYINKTDKTSTKTLVLLDKGDELFDINDTIATMIEYQNVMINTFDGGNHSFIHLKESLPIIKEFINYDKL